VSAAVRQGSHTCVLPCQHQFGGLSTSKLQDLPATVDRPAAKVAAAAEGCSLPQTPKLPGQHGPSTGCANSNCGCATHRCNREQSTGAAAGIPTLCWSVAVLRAVPPRRWELRQQGAAQLLTYTRSLQRLLTHALSAMGTVYSSLGRAAQTSRCVWAGCALQSWADARQQWTCVDMLQGR
jgi:hypothetical protein